MIIAGIALVAAGCREDVGNPDYSGLQDVFDSIGEEDNLPELMGPDPFVEGEQRLSLGLFYESGFSEVVPVDGGQASYFIFLADEQLSYSQQTDTDRIEGQQSDRITLAGTSFWGGGIVWEPTIDLSDFDVLAVSLRSNDLDAVNITMGSAGTEIPVAASDFGYANDGQWHSLRIPLQEFIDGGADLSATRLAFAIGGPGGNAGAQILVDDLYIERE